MPELSIILIFLVVLEFEDTLLFFALPELALKLVHITKLHPLTRLQIVLEVTVVCDVVLYICALTVGLAVAHLPLVVVAVCVDYPAVSFSYS